MAFTKSGLMAAAALIALGACATAAPMEDQAATGIYAGKSVLDVGMEAAGGEAALGKVKELYWTGHARTTAADKVTEVEVATVIRPFENARFTSWAKAAGPKKGRTLQIEQGKAWDVNRVVWTPLPEAQAQNENELLGFYSAMLLAPLKSAGATVTEQPAAADGARAIQATVHGQTIELAFDAAGKLVRASGNVADPKGGAAIAQVATFSGEVESNGVKWPKTISITHNGAPFYDLEITHFEALAAKVVRPLEQSMQYDPKAVVPGEGGDAG
jgi:hypothetical protein